LIKIFFHHQDETEFIYTQLKQYESANFQLLKEPHCLHIEYGDETNLQSAQSILHVAIKKLILNKKRIDWWTNILQSEFYYSDREEQMQIIDIALSILDGKRTDIHAPIDYQSDMEKLDQAIQDVITSSNSFSFDAFITFRMRFFTENLMSVIEIAIDEYKLEQEYQMFIHYLRTFVRGRSPVMKVIQIVNEDGFIFFDEENHEIKRSELNKLIDRKLINHHPIYVDSTTIAPLISIAPEKILLYTDQEEQGIIQTLKRIFEERLSVLPIREFEKR